MATKQPEETLEYEDFLSWTVTSLKDFLAIRGLKQSGKKAELVARAFGAHELGVPKKFTQEQIFANIKKEYVNRLKENGIKTDPNGLPDEAWTDSVQTWPEVDDGTLFSYILRIKAVDVDYIGKYKDQKAYSYWMSGFVDTVYLAKCPSDRTLTFLKGKVCPSQRLRDDPHKVWVCVKGKEQSRIVTSWCTCIAGTGEVCNHVIALLYKVNYAYNKQYISPACTSIPQGWNKGTKKEVTPSKLENLSFRKDKKTRKECGRNPGIDQTMRKQFDPRKPEDKVITNEQVSSLLNNIKDVLPSACVLYSVEHAKDDGLPLPLTKKASDFMSSADVEGKPLEEVAPLFIQSCQMTSEQVQRIELSTRGQQSNELWQDQRTGRITASNFHQVSTKTHSLMSSSRKRSNKPQYTPLVAKLLFKPEDISHLPPISWGVTHEKDGIQSFMSDVASQHEGGLQGFQQCGLFVKPGYPYLAASPDGCFTCRCCGPATVEVKCPYSVRTENILNKDVYKRVEFLEDNNGQPRLKRTHKYYTQVQAQMWMCNVDHCFFIVWTEGHKPFYERVELDQNFCESVISNLTVFYKSYVLPCLLGYRNIFQCPKCEKVILENEEINEPAQENSISCDNCGTWWHLQCAGLTTQCADTLESWLCFGCLVDAAATGSDEGDGAESDDSPGTPSTSEDATRKSKDGICSVCLLNSIPVGGEHVCTICKNAVHAWCSNHEDITSSSNLICNYCKSIE